MLFHPPSVKVLAQAPVPSEAAQHDEAPSHTHRQGPQLASRAILPSQKEFPRTGWASLVEVVNAAGVKRKPGEGQMEAGRE